MKKLKHLFENNKKWAKEILEQNPDFFNKLSKQQNPKYLWIGCSDSRVPANQITGLDPGEVFVHRNVANLVVHTDFNCLSVIQYAVDVLKVTDIILCGHYNCGGVAAALKNDSFGIIDNWIRNIKDVYFMHRDELDALPDNSLEKVNRLCELNVKEQVANLCHTTIIQDAWRRNQELAVHGWIYGLDNGLLKDLNLCFTDLNQVHEVFRYGH